MNIQKKIILLFILFLLAFSFYWFQLRPAMIRSYCNRQYERFSYKTYKEKYEKCLHTKGLE